MKDVQDWIAVKRMYDKGVKIKQIARELKMSKNTVKRLIKLNKEPIYNRQSYSTKVDDYKDKIKEWYVSPEYSYIGTRIFRELKKLGYTGSIGPLYRFLKTLKEEKHRISSKATLRFETPMGDQAQFDWSPYKMVIGNEIREVYCFTMILCASRKKAGVFSLTSDGDAIYEAIQELFENLGGVTLEIVVDNPKALVISHESGSETKYNLNALRLAAHLGTELNACNPYRARTKGKIEKPYQYIEEQFIKGNSYTSMMELNAAAKDFFNEWNQAVHGTTKRIPDEMFKEEISNLLPLPKKRFMHSPLTRRKVSLDSLISVGGKKYSVPVEYVDKHLQYRIVYGYKLEIYNDKLHIVAIHEVNDKDVTRAKEHYLPITYSVPRSIPEIKRQFKAVFKNGEQYLDKASKVLQQPSYHTREILKLKELYTLESLDKILAYCIDKEIYTIEDIKKVLKEKYIDIVFNNGLGQNKLDVTQSSLQDDSLIRDISYYEGGGQN